MSVLRAVLVLLGALTLQQVLAELSPATHRVADLLLVVVTLYGTMASQRSAMIVGGVSGLLRDAWFELGVFGISGVKRTVLGWLVGAINKRFDMNNLAGRLLAGAGTALGDSVLDVGLRRLLDRDPGWSSPLALVAHAVVTALLVAVAGSIVDRRRERTQGSRSV